MWYRPTEADIIGSLPPAEQAELITLADAYGIPLEPADRAEPPYPELGSGPDRPGPGQELAERPRAALAVVPSRAGQREQRLVPVPVRMGR